MIYVNIQCKECLHDNVICHKNEADNEIYCVCLTCNKKGVLSHFEYELDGDTEE